MAPSRENRPVLSSLRVEELVLDVRLGCSAEERARPQEVRVSIEFRFATPPAGTVTDALEDTICYAKVSRAVQEHCESREFNLIERIGAECLALLRRMMDDEVQIGLSIHKVHPPVNKLRGGTYYRCGDFLL